MYLRSTDNASNGTSSGVTNSIQRLVERTYFSKKDREVNRVNGLEDEVKVSDRFPYPLLMKISSSEPRDLLQLEQTYLIFLRFGTTLFITSLGIVLNFKFDSSKSGRKFKKDFLKASKFSKAIAYILIALSIFVLVLSTLNYFNAVKRYANRKIHTRVHNTVTVVSMTAIMLILMGISILLIVEAYKDGQI